MKIKTGFVISLIHLLILVSGFAQGQSSEPEPWKPWCGTLPKGKLISGGSKGENFDNQISRFIDSNLSSARLASSGVIVIPVVFHVVLHTQQEHDAITPFLLQQQITRLNTDLRRRNTDANTGVPQVWQNLRFDSRIEFKLACIDPQGQFLQDGAITRTWTSVPVFSGDGLANPRSIKMKKNSLGGKDAWPTDKYLNIWICNVDGFYGQATYPNWYNSDFTWFNPATQTSMTVPGSELDGIVLDYRVVGFNISHPTKNKGRVAVHEIGHWLGLYHLYEFSCTNEGDEVLDTPPQDMVTPETCPTGIVYGLNCPTSPGPGMMYMNFMDQSADNCLLFFTSGQVQRMRNFIAVDGLNSRFGFMYNYFNIAKFPPGLHIVQNNTIRIPINNPACLQVRYTITGPVTEVSHTDYEIILSVPCNTSGNVTITAIARNEATIVFNNIVDNYIDDYTFSFENQAACETWPKKYFWFDPELFPSSNNDFSVVTKGKNGNLFYSIGSASFNNNFNHIGAIPPSNNNQYLVHYSSNGTTNWVKDNLTNTGDVFVMGNGSVRTKITTVSPDYVYLDEANGNITTGPSYVPGDEKILAETITGIYITYKNGQLFVRSPTTTTSVSQNVEYTIFNKNTNRLFVQESITNDFPASGAIKIYSLINGSLILANSNIPAIPGHLLYHVDNIDNVYTLDMRCGTLPIYKFEYSTNTYGLFTFPDFINNNVLTFKRQSHLDDPYASDVFAVITNNPNGNGRITNVINIADNTCKQISGTSNANWSCLAALGWGFNNYIIDGDNLYMAGNIFANISNDIPVVIGQQTITSLPPLSFYKNTNYLAKFSISGDFNRVNQSGLTKNIEPTSINNFGVNLSPNPATNILSININQIKTDKAVHNGYRVSITDKFGIQVLQKNSSRTLISLEISTLPMGVYFVVVTNDMGEKVSSSFIKQ